MAEPQKLKVTQTSTKAQAAGAGSLGVSSLVVSIVQLFQIQMTPEQLAALVTIAGAIAAFGGAWFATNSPVVQDAEQKDAAIPVNLLPPDVRIDRVLPEPTSDASWRDELKRIRNEARSGLSPDELDALRKLLDSRDVALPSDQPLATIPTGVVDPARKIG